MLSVEETIAMHFARIEKAAEPLEVVIRRLWILKSSPVLSITKPISAHINRCLYWAAERLNQCSGLVSVGRVALIKEGLCGRSGWDGAMQWGDGTITPWLSGGGG